MQATTEPRGVRTTTWVVSSVVCLAVAFLILGPRPSAFVGQIDVSALPTVNASLNALTTVLLLCGFTAIKLDKRKIHAGFMSTAMVSSTLFLASYVLYHWFKPGPAVYEGSFRWLYLVILVSHILLAVAVVPMAITTFLRAAFGAFARHRRIAPWTFGVWLYVSVTGVAIYWMVHT